MALDRRRLYKVRMIDRSSAWFRAFVCCLLLAFTSGALANASAAVGIVLCVGLDGHVAIETARGPDCADLLDHAAPASMPPETAATAAAHCHDCLDIALADASAAASVAKLQVTAARHVDDVPVLPVFLLAALAARPLPRELGPPPLRAERLPDLTLLAHRTDVLLV